FAMARLLADEGGRLRDAARHPFFAAPRTVFDAAATELARRARHLSLGVRSRLHADASALERVSARLETHRPGVLYARREQRLESARLRLAAAMSSRLAAAPPDPLERALELVGPASVLSRGYSATLR